MVLKSKTTGSSTNPLRFSEIEDEFGINSSGINLGKRSLGNYRVSQSFGKLINQPLDAGIPQSVAIGSSQISFDNFYSKQANVIVDCYTTGSQNCNHDAYINRFAVNKYEIVGRFRTGISKDNWDGGKKVIIHVNKTFSSFNAVDDNDVALKVGSIEASNESDDEDPNAWPTDTILSVNIGTQGLVVGKGGDGGRGGYGGNESLVPGDGEPGSSGLKRHSGMSITGETRIRGGGGGGGGGLGVSSLNENDDEPACRTFGGGGGGGAGVPNGEGGASGVNVGSLPGVEGLDSNNIHPFDHNGVPGTDGEVSVTRTFNGSSSSVVTINGNTIQINAHPFKHGQRVVYSNGGGSNIGGLTNGTTYFCITKFDNATLPNLVSLAINETNSRTNIAINLTGTGSGSSHSLTLVDQQGGAGARIVQDTDESGIPESNGYVMMGRGGNGGGVQNNGNGSNGGNGSDNIIGPHWVDDTPTGFGEGGLGGLRYITY